MGKILNTHSVTTREDQLLSGLDLSHAILKYCKKKHFVFSSNNKLYSNSTLSQQRNMSIYIKERSDGCVSQGCSHLCKLNIPWARKILRKTYHCAIFLSCVSIYCYAFYGPHHYLQYESQLRSTQQFTASYLNMKAAANRITLSGQRRREWTCLAVKCISPWHCFNLRELMWHFYFLGEVCGNTK